MQKKNDYEPSKSVKIVTQNKKIISCAIIILYILVIGIVYWLFKGDLEKTNYVSQIIGGVLVVGGLVVSVLQYTASSVDNNILREQERKIKAAEMANQFQADIIPLSNILVEAYAKSNLKNTILSKIENRKLEMFNKDEVLEIVTEKERNECYYMLYGGYIMGHYMEEDFIKTEDGKLQPSKKMKTEAEKEIDFCILNLANKLEYFSICFNSGIADEDTVYQSLHSVFFDCVHMLYIFIFYSNQSESDRLFSNISYLYTKWHERYEQLVEQEKKELHSMKKDVQKKIVVNAKK